MKYRLFVDILNRVWERETIEVEADSLQSAVEKAKKRLGEGENFVTTEEFDIIEYALLYETMEELEVAHNDNNPTREILVDMPGGKTQSVLWNNIEGYTQAKEVKD